jgi:hypothetical protein
MADPNKFKSVSVPIDTYHKLVYLSKGKFLDAELTISKNHRSISNKSC